MAQGAIGHGMTLSIGGSTVGYIQNISDGGTVTDMIEASSADSTNAIKEKVAGMIDGGEVTLTIKYDPLASTGGQAVLKAVQAQRIPYSTLITLPKVNATATSGTSSFSGSAFVSRVGNTFPYQDLMMTEATLTPETKLTFNSAS